MATRVVTTCDLCGREAREEEMKERVFFLMRVLCREKAMCPELDVCPSCYTLHVAPVIDRAAAVARGPRAV